MQRLRRPRSDATGAHNGMCAAVHAYDSEMRNLSCQLQLSPARARSPEIIRLLMQVRGHAQKVLLHDGVHECGAWCASKARLQAAVKIA
eukprot:2280912-Pleurochrysis_carterae.AAC.1